MLLLRWVLISSIFWAGITVAKAIDLTTIDLSHQYDPDAPVKVKHRVMQIGDELRVYLDIEMDSSFVWQKEYYLQRGYDALDDVLVRPVEIATDSSATQWTGYITLPAPRIEDLLIIKFVSEFEFFFDIPVRFGRYTAPSFIPLSKGKPVLTHYLNSQSLHWTDSSSMLVGSYRDKFGPAEAPMEEMKALVPILAEDTAFQMIDSTFLKDYHFYFFRLDSATDKGLTLMKVPPYYPTFRMIGELIGPMRYITTDAEFRMLTESTRPKVTFDEFWINTYGTKFRARNAIRKFFNSVEYANEYFTGFKQGWKTDQGMVFIVYGTPYEMYRTDSGERWVYENVEYEFVKVSTLFGPLYALKKDRRYEKEWYDQVGLLRKGE